MLFRSVAARFGRAEAATAEAGLSFLTDLARLTLGAGGGAESTSSESKLTSAEWETELAAEGRTEEVLWSSVIMMGGVEPEATTTPVEVRREKVTLRSWRGQTAFVEFKSS